MVNLPSGIYYELMAAPITHILFTTVIPKTVSDDFIAGVSFPDIRYLGSISRERTHAYGSDKVTDSTSFTSGMAFHQYVDEARGEYWKDNGIYEQLPDTPLTAQALKFCEDIILYESFDRWQSIARLFHATPAIPTEYSDAISPSEMHGWYQLIAHYLNEKPDIEKIAYMMKQIGFEDKVAAKIEIIMKQILANTDMVQAIKQYYIDLGQTINKKLASL